MFYAFNYQSGFKTFVYFGKFNLFLNREIYECRQIKGPTTKKINKFKSTYRHKCS